MKDNYAEYPYYSGTIIFCSYAFKRGEGFIAFDYIKGGDGATIKGTKRSHPVRRDIHDDHREAFTETGSD